MSRFDEHLFGRLAIYNRILTKDQLVECLALQRVQAPDERQQIGEILLERGYITQALGRWPKPGDEVPIGSYTARVLSVTQKRAKQVLLTPTNGSPQSNGSPQEQSAAEVTGKTGEDKK